MDLQDPKISPVAPELDQIDKLGSKMSEKFSNRTRMKNGRRKEKAEADKKFKIEERKLCQKKFHKEEQDLLYKSMTTRPQLYLLVYGTNLATTNTAYDATGEEHQVPTSSYIISIETLPILLVFENYDLSRWIDLNLVIGAENRQLTSMLTDVSIKGTGDMEDARVAYQSNSLIPSKFLREQNEYENHSVHCKYPYVNVEDKRLTIAGLSSTIRFLLRYCSLKAGAGAGDESSDDEKKEAQVLNSLLGFKKSCLQSCSESSSWTKFCEVDLIQRATSTLLKRVREVEKYLVQQPSNPTLTSISLPVDIARFEEILQEPLRLHNIQKKVQDIANREHKYDEGSKLEHLYAEGIEMTLADLIVYPVVQLASQVLGEPVFEQHLPNVLSWSKRVGSESGLSGKQMSYHILGLSASTVEFIATLSIQIPNTSLTSNVDSSYVFSNKHTQHNKIRKMLKIFPEAGVTPMDFMNNNCDKSELDLFLDWETVPELVNPVDDLPTHRRERKNEQIANMVQMIQFVYKKECMKRIAGGNNCEPIKIADFCSGGGHLGIVLAWLFPDSQVFLIENKEESIRRAESRISALNLKNVLIFQCNLTQFIEKFDIGCALHACGSSTDLVLAECLKQSASFIVSPCCYGCIKDNSSTSYPLSRCFREVGNNNGNNTSTSKAYYLTLAHTADQTQLGPRNSEKIEQGKYAMKMIDTDRYLAFIEKAATDSKNYDIWLKLMDPPTCSPKNHILVGFCSSHGEK